MISNKFKLTVYKKISPSPDLQLAVATVFPISDDGNIILLAGPKMLESVFGVFFALFTSQHMVS